MIFSPSPISFFVVKRIIDLLLRLRNTRLASQSSALNCRASCVYELDLSAPNVGYLVFHYGKEDGLLSLPVRYSC
jgi:hypothetical protein